MDWNGKTMLGDGWAVYEGPRADSRPHRHLAVQLAIGLKEPVAVTGDRGTVVGPASALGSGSTPTSLQSGARCFRPMQRVPVPAPTSTIESPFEGAIKRNSAD